MVVQDSFYCVYWHCFYQFQPASLQGLLLLSWGWFVAKLVLNFIYPQQLIYNKNKLRFAPIGICNGQSANRGKTENDDIDLKLSNLTYKHRPDQNQTADYTRRHPLSMYYILICISMISSEKKTLKFSLTRF